MIWYKEGIAARALASFHFVGICQGSMFHLACSGYTYYGRKSSNMSRDERATTWPVVFSAKGPLRSGYVHKGQAAKLFDSEANNFKYALLDGQHNMFGAEDSMHGLPTRRPDKLKDVGAVTYGLVAQVENVKYDIMVHVAHDWS